VNSPNNITPYELGKLGERFAVHYLKKKKYKIIERGFRLFRGDIDIIAYDGRILVFIEIKTRRGKRFGFPEEAVQSSKQKQIRKIAKGFISLNKLEKKACRFDVLALDYHESKGFKVTHFKDAF
jgi:putative endonuclease